MSPSQLWLSNWDPACSRPSAAGLYAQDPARKAIVLNLTNGFVFLFPTHLIDNGRVLQVAQIEHAH